MEYTQALLTPNTAALRMCSANIYPLCRLKCQPLSHACVEQPKSNSLQGAEEENPVRRLSAVNIILTGCK